MIDLKNPGKSVEDGKSVRQVYPGSGRTRRGAIDPKLKSRP
jgi:hypothetical protein